MTACEGWVVGDVAAHVVGTPKQLADECAEVRAAAANLLPAFDDAAWDGPAPGGYDGSTGEAVEALWYDAYLHADDIRAALGIQTEVGPGLEAATSHVELFLGRLGWSGEIPTDDAEAHSFVLAATGRAAGSVPNIYA